MAAKEPAAAKTTATTTATTTAPATPPTGDVAAQLKALAKGASPAPKAQLDAVDADLVERIAAEGDAAPGWEPWQAALAAGRLLVERRAPERTRALKALAAIASSNAKVYQALQELKGSA
jgi:hypothetical protein